ncbi:alpha/beta hydrolase [Amycolatopsis sp. 3B14]|uniref:alpha/beta hydrolase n=1 Tax=Amycolatopsis sp. 3B14 TaxID=3243600 RepID=UPI003D999F03
MARSPRRTARCCRLAEVLGRRGGFVGADNGGHYVYGQGSTCVDQATVTFLTTGRLPDENLHRTGQG